MANLYLTRGLPASGKTVYAKALVTVGNGSTKRVSKEVLRPMLDNDFRLGDIENERTHLSAVIDMIAEYYLKNDYDVVIDETFAQTWELDTTVSYFAVFADVIVLDHFLKVPLSVCIERDKARTPSLGIDVLKDYVRTFEEQGIQIPR